MNAETDPSDEPVEGKGIKVCIIGSQGAGKTCFLGGLALHTEATRQASPFELIGLTDEDDSDRNPSQEFLNGIGATLRDRNWPPATVSISMLRYELRYKRFVSELTVVDYPGEEMREAMHSLAPNRIAKFAETLQAATHLLVLMDPIVDLRVSGSGRALDLRQQAQFHERIKAPINALVWCLSERQEQLPPHICLIITKADQVEGILAPGGCKSLRSDVLESLKSRLEKLAQDKVGVFAVSAVGAVTELESRETDGQVSIHSIPGDAEGVMEPKGYECLFDWIFSRQLREQRRKKVLITAAFAFILLVVTAFVGWLEFSAIVTIRNKQLPVADRLAPCKRVWTTWGKDAAHQFLGAELENLSERLNRTNRFQECDPLLADLTMLTTAANDEERKRIEALEQNVFARQRELEFKGIMAMPTGPARENRLRQFIANCPGSNEASKARDELDKTVDARMAERRLELRGRYPLLTIYDFSAKATAMEKFTEEFGGKVSDSQSILSAAKVAHRIADTNGQFQISIRGFSGFSEPRYHYLKITVAKDGDAIFWKENQKAKETTEEAVRTVNWKPNDRVRVEVQVDTTWNYVPHWKWAVPAASEQSGPLSIALLGQGQLTLDETKDINLVPWLTARQARISIKGFDADDWKLARQYIHPGDSW